MPSSPPSAATSTTAADAALVEITARVHAAAASKTALRIRGGATKDFHGGLALQGQLLDTRALCGIIAYEPSELVVTARAGTPLAELEALLAGQGQCLPFEPPHFAHRAAGRCAGADANAAVAHCAIDGRGAGAGTAAASGVAYGTGADNIGATTSGPSAPPSTGATVGGMVACGLSGPARASVGAVRDHVLGATLLNGRAELLRFGGQVMKNVAGYDVSRLMTGAWGTLGLLTEISLKVLPAAPAEATLCLDCGQRQALRLLHTFGRQPLPLNASRWQQEDDAGGADGVDAAHATGSIAAAPAPNAAGRLYIRLRGAAAAVQAACKLIGGERIAQPQAAADWAACRDQRLHWFAARRPGHALWRLSLPATTPALDWPGCKQPPLIEWHGALRWLHAPAAAGQALRAAARAAGGSASLFVAADTDDAGAACALELQSEALLQIHQRLKDSFDPARIFNPGRMGLVSCHA